MNPDIKNTVKASGLSGNEMYCLALLGYAPENLLIGNSVFSMGFIGGIASQFRSAIGGEITQVTNMIAEGRRLSLDRFNQELSNGNYAGATGLTSELIFHPGNVEFLTIGSAVSSNNGVNRFTSSSDGQELFCQWDAGYQPINFIFGNVAYSIGLVKGILGEFKQLKKGEVQQYSDIFNQTRNLALDRIITEAKNNGANSVVGIRTTILPVGISPVQEMVMIGTASYNSQINSIAGIVNGVTTSDMTAEETWNVAKLGYAPLKLVLGTSIYSLGLVGGLKAGLKNFVKGEISELTNMIYGAREQSINRLTQQAQEIGADDILGIKTYIYNLGGGLIEFLAIGTAVKKIDGLTTNSQQIPPQAIIRDKTTFINATVFAEANNLQRPQELADNNGQ